MIQGVIELMFINVRIVHKKGKPNDFRRMSNKSYTYSTTEKTIKLGDIVMVPDLDTRRNSNDYELGRVTAIDVIPPLKVNIKSILGLNQHGEIHE